MRSATFVFSAFLALFFLTSGNAFAYDRTFTIDVVNVFTILEQHDVVGGDSITVEHSGSSEQSHFEDDHTTISEIEGRDSSSIFGDDHFSLFDSLSSMISSHYIDDDSETTEVEAEEETTSVESVEDDFGSWFSSSRFFSSSYFMQQFFK